MEPRAPRSEGTRSLEKAAPATFARGLLMYLASGGTSTSAVVPHGNHLLLSMPLSHGVHSSTCVGAHHHTALCLPLCARVPVHECVSVRVRASVYACMWGWVWVFARAGVVFYSMEESRSLVICWS